VAPPFRAASGSGFSDVRTPFIARGRVSAPAMKPGVLIVDNDLERGEMLLDMLAPGYECRRVRSLDEAFAAIGRSPWDVVLSNYDLGPCQSGIELLQAMREISPRAVRVLYCRHYCDGLAHDAARLAAAHAVVNAQLPDFPVTLHETLERLLLSPSPTLPPVPLEVEEEPAWIVNSAASKEFVRVLVAAAGSECPAFLHGEQGTGKSFAATLFLKWRSRWRAGAGRDDRRAGAHVAATPVVIVAVPPLRERLDDIPALARYCLERHARRNGDAVRHLTAEAHAELLRRPWWGNVRELHGVLIRGCQRAGPRLGLAAADLPGDAEPPPQPSQGAKDAGQRECVLRQLRTAGNVSGAARLEGITRTNYIRLMRRLGILRADTAPAGDPDPADMARSAG
jgi:DNA-binding NtrC family response regulator